VPATAAEHGGGVVIILTRLNGSEVGLNPDLIERVETTGDTVVSLIDGTRYVVGESCSQVVDRVVEFRARVLAAADHAAAGAGPTTAHPVAGPLRLVLERDDRAEDPTGGVGGA
jgi:flagellar protein FlbD